MTNYEKIKAMSVEEMVNALYDGLRAEACKMRGMDECIGFEDCVDCIKAMLLQEAKE